MFNPLKNPHPNKRHGKSESKVYAIWTGMRTRCLNKKSTAYSYYGGRGVSICKRWILFENFYKDMGEPPEGMTLDRINSEGNYEPFNCRWATRKMQSRNRRNNIFLTLNGVTKMLEDWSRDLGINQQTLSERLKKDWPVERILSKKGCLS